MSAAEVYKCENFFVVCLRLWSFRPDRLAFVPSPSVHDIVRAAGIVAPPQDTSQQTYTATPQRPSPIERTQPSLFPQPFAAAVARPPPSLVQPTPTAAPTTSIPTLLAPTTTRPAPINPTQAPTTLPRADFSPLVTALQSRPTHPPPLRSLVGELVLRIQPKAFAMVGTTTCREYFDAARAAGIVSLGNGEKAGAEWIGLVASTSNSDLQPLSSFVGLRFHSK